MQEHPIMFTFGTIASNFKKRNTNCGKIWIENEREKNEEYVSHIYKKV